jgi:hypothetical protein
MAKNAVTNILHIQRCACIKRKVLHARKCHWRKVSKKKEEQGKIKGKWKVKGKVCQKEGKERHRACANMAVSRGGRQYAF